MPHTHAQMLVLIMEKVSLQTNLGINPSNYVDIFFLLVVNFENLTVELHVLIISSMIAKFQENQKSVAILSIKCLNFKFL